MHLDQIAPADSLQTDNIRKFIEENYSRGQQLAVDAFLSDFKSLIRSSAKPLTRPRLKSLSSLPQITDGQRRKICRLSCEAILGKDFDTETRLFLDSLNILIREECVDILQKILLAIPSQPRDPAVVRSVMALLTGMQTINPAKNILKSIREIPAEERARAVVHAATLCKDKKALARGYFQATSRYQRSWVIEGHRKQTAGIFEILINVPRPFSLISTRYLQECISSWPDRIKEPLFQRRLPYQLSYLNNIVASNDVEAALKEKWPDDVLAIELCSASTLFFEADVDDLEQIKEARERISHYITHRPELRETCLIEILRDIGLMSALGTTFADDLAEIVRRNSAHEFPLYSFIAPLGRFEDVLENVRFKATLLWLACETSEEYQVLFIECVAELFNTMEDDTVKDKFLTFMEELILPNDRLAAAPHVYKFINSVSLEVSHTPFSQALNEIPQQDLPSVLAIAAPFFDFKDVGDNASWFLRRLYSYLRAEGAEFMLSVCQRWGGKCRSQMILDILETITGCTHEDRDLVFQEADKLMGGSFPWVAVPFWVTDDKVVEGQNYQVRYIAFKRL